MDQMGCAGARLMWWLCMKGPRSSFAAFSPWRLARCCGIAMGPRWESLHICMTAGLQSLYGHYTVLDTCAA